METPYYWRLLRPTQLKRTSFIPLYNIMWIIHDVFRSKHKGITFISVNSESFIFEEIAKGANLVLAKIQHRNWIL